MKSHTPFLLSAISANFTAPFIIAKVQTTLHSLKWYIMLIYDESANYYALCAGPCIQSLQVSVYRANTTSVENFTIGDPSVFQYFDTPSPVVALHGVENEACLQRLGGYQLLPESEVQRECM